MAYTHEQRLKLYADHFRHLAMCPKCGGPLDFTPKITTGQPGLYKCPDCGESENMARTADPLSASFRPYTSDEKAALVAADKAKQPTFCPVDGAPMDVYPGEGMNPNTIIQCPRCAKNAQYLDRR